MEWHTVINLEKSFFTEKEKVLAVIGDTSASTFLFNSGVHGLRIKNNCGSITMLPYQGQQVWSCNFYGRELAMKSVFSQPVVTREYLETYGGFLLHCGATAMGVPSERDSHPLHGELPNAPYQKAYLIIGRDELGSYIGLGGEYRHMVAFNHNYLAEPFVKIYESSSIIHSSITITNLKNTDMELMYMMHVNFRPVDNGTLIYSAQSNHRDIKVHINIPEHMKTSTDTSKLKDFLMLLAENPALHDILKPELVFDPEVVFTIRYKADENGDSHSMQVHPDGYASYISHRPSELEYGVRWIARTKDEDALGLVLPATAEHKGYTAEKEKGNIKVIPAGSKVAYHVKAGLLNPSDAEDVKVKIRNILAGS